MPIHLVYQGTTCKKCGTEFIATPQDNKCPQCGAPAAKTFDFAAATIATMKDHKQIYGNYFPESWFAGSIADLVQGILFELFDNLESRKPKDIRDFISTQLSVIEWEDGQIHLGVQTQKLALQIYEIYKSDPDFRPDALKGKPLDPKMESMKSRHIDIDNISNI